MPIDSTLEPLPQKQKGYILTKEGISLRSDLPVARDVPPQYVLLKVMSASVCGTDLELMKGKNNPWTSEHVFPHLYDDKPLTIGHEFCGKVVRAGDNTHVKIGTIGGVESHYACPECVKKGINGHECKHYGIFGIWGHKVGDNHKRAPVIGGGYSQYVLMPETNFYDGGFLFKKFHCSLCEPCGNTWAIMEDLNKRGLLDSLLIFGAGPHGLNLQCFAHYFRVKNIVVVEPNDYRRAFSRGLGASSVILKPDMLTSARAKELTLGKGFDAVLDMVGLQSVVDNVIEMDLVREGGVMGLFGLPKKPHQTISEKKIDMNTFIFERMEMQSKTKSGRKFTYVGYTGRTHHAMRSLIDALNHPEKGDELCEMLERQLRIEGSLDKLKIMLGTGFPANMDSDDLKIGFTAFE